MDSLQKLLTRISTQLRDLTASQKIALFLGGLLVAISLAWLAQWAATPDMTPLLAQSLSAEEIASIRSGLDAMNEPYKIAGDRVLVRASSNARAIMAQLQQTDRMPTDLTTGFESLVKEANPWISQAENDRRWTVALQRELEGVLRNFQGVKAARVFLNLNAQRSGFSRIQPANSASVTLISAGGEPIPRSVGLAAARFVAGAVRGLSVQNVSVVDSSGATVVDWEQDSASGSALNRENAQVESQIRDKIRSQLAFDPKVLVNVRVDTERSTRSISSESLTDPVDISEETSSETRTRLQRSGQPGAQPNVGVEVSAGASGGENYAKETVRNEKRVGVSRTTATTPSGEVVAIFAAINISHTYLESVYRRFHPDATQPTLQQIEEIFEQERARIVAQVSKLVKAAGDQRVEEQIAVTWYYDAGDDAPAASASAMDRSFDLAQRFGPQAGLGLLALASLGLMFKLARKQDAGDAFGIDLGLPKEAIEAAKAAAKDVASAVRSGPAGGGARGSAGSSAPPVAANLPTTAATEAVLIGQEVDESTVQLRKMLDEVGEMASAEPETLSTLVEQWIERSDAFRG